MVLGASEMWRYPRGCIRDVPTSLLSISWSSGDRTSVGLRDGLESEGLVSGSFLETINMTGSRNQGT